MPDTTSPTPNNSPSTNRPRPVLLCILDGWGDRAAGDDNAIYKANTPNWDRLTKSYPASKLEASALDVGLPEGQMGNSEVGHMNIGAGRVVMQDLPLIDQAIKDGSLAELERLNKYIDALKASGGTCHLMGLLSPGGVHSHQDHMVALAEIFAGAGVPVLLHAFLDGRDTPPSSAEAYVADVERSIAGLNDVSIATISGRYYAMDRDQRWDRVTLAYDCLTAGQGETADSADGAISQSYQAGTTDEFVLPTAIGGYAGMQDGDGILMANFRADRARQLLTALLDPAFAGFERQRLVDFADKLGMTEYSADITKLMDALFPQRPLTNILGEVVAGAGLTQLRIAETEKYAHVTFFFNGGEETMFEGEERILVPSPKVATYDLQPEMSALEVTIKLVEAIESAKFDLIVANYANGDMVGHTGVFDAAIKAAETVDNCLGQLEAAITAAGGTMMITADHGNVEQMFDDSTGQPHTAHTTLPVPFVMVGAPTYVDRLENGVLADIAPTILRLMELDQPAEMSGRCLINETVGEQHQAERADA